MTSYNRDGKVGPWAEEKLKCLSDYLSAYTTILRNQTWCRGYFYMDAFAGAGRAELRLPNDERMPPAGLLLQVNTYDTENTDEVSYLDGSPHAALNIRYPFTHYIFIEKRPDRVSQLRDLGDKYLEQCRIQIIQDDATAVIERFLADDSIDWRRYRGVIFLDPFGMQISWRTIESIAHNGKIEIILNLPIGMTIERLLPRSGQFSDIQRQRLTEYFGSPHWEEVIYERTTDLFGQAGVYKMQGSGERLAYWYRDRLEEAFGFVAPEPRLIRNSQGGHLYYLLFAGPNKTGAKIASHILKQGRRVPRPQRVELPS